MKIIGFALGLLFLTITFPLSLIGVRISGESWREFFK